MATLRESLRLAGQSARANFLPGLVLQALLLIFLLLYLTHGGTQDALRVVAETKQQAGFLFAFLTYVFAGALLPEVMRIVLFQKGGFKRENMHSFFTLAPMWGGIGMLVDLLYRLQNTWFGTGNDWQTLMLKVFVDQAIFSLFICNPLIVAYLMWREDKFSPSVWRKIWHADFIWERLFPVQVAAWCVWIPGVTLVYFMPPLLELPVAALIQCFWVLLLATVNYRVSARMET
jgi:hypothetical protein